MRAIALIAALDTKGEEAQFLQKEIEKRDHKSLVIDIGIIGKPRFQPDISRYQVARAAGSSIRRLIKAGSHAAAVEAMAAGARSIVGKLHARGQLHGVVSAGGGQNTAIATAAMRVLPLGVPKLMVSTIAARDTRPYIGTRDIVMMPSVTDMGGLNHLLRQTLSQAAGAICGMVEANGKELHFAKPLIGMTMFGVTTPCVLRAKARIEQLGYETLIFHANGLGGRVMEELIEDGKIGGVLDIATTELADELVGGVLSAGPDRLNAAGKLGIPQVVCPGALDMVNLDDRESVPRKFQKRRLLQHRQEVTLMRTTKRENEKLGRLMAEKLNRARGPVVVAVPQKGFSAHDRKSGPFFDPAADRAFTRALESDLREGIEVRKIDAHINDERFAVEIASILAEMLGKRKGPTTRHRGRKGWQRNTREKKS